MLKSDINIQKFSSEGCIALKKYSTGLHLLLLNQTLFLFGSEY